MSHRLLPSLLVASIATLAACGGTTPVPAEPAEPVWAEPDELAEPADEPVAPADAAAAAAGVRIADTGTLLLEGTPEIPAELRERLLQYINTRSASLADLSDDGSQALVLTRFGETRQLHRLARPMGARTQVTFRDEPVRGAWFVPGAADAVLYTADVGGDEQHQLYRFDLATGRATRVTDPTSRNQSTVWAKDGRRVAFASNARNGRDFDLWVADIAGGGAPERVLDTSGYWYPVDWSHDGTALLVGQYVSITDSRLHVLDLTTGTLSRVSPEEPNAAYLGAVFSRDGKSIYVASDREGEFRELYETDRAGRVWRPLSRDLSWDVESLALSPDGRTLAFTTNEDGYSVLRLLDTRTRKARPLAGVPRGIINDLQFARRAGVLGFTLYTPSSTGDAYTYDLRRRALVRWTESEMGGLDPSRFVEPTVIRYESFDGREISALYYRPPGDGPFPVIIDIHGGPEAQSRPYFRATTQYLASERGIAVLYPNVRGSSGYGKTYLSLDDGKRREDSVRDIGALLDWVGAQPELDAERVGVRGGSYGGYMVLASLVHYGDRIVAGLNVVGISNFVTFLTNTADYRRDLRRVEYGDERDPEMRAFLEKISPLSSVDRIRSALFVAQGANDPRVPESEARQIVDAVRGTGADVWYMLARNEGHGFARKENADVMALLGVLFFERHLLGAD